MNRIFSFNLTNPEGSDPGGVVFFAFFQIIAHIPDGPVVNWIDGSLSIIFPPAVALLGSLSGNQNGFMESKFPRRIVRQTAAKTLTCEIIGSAEGVSGSQGLRGFGSLDSGYRYRFNFLKVPRLNQQPLPFIRLSFFYLCQDGAGMISIIDSLPG